MDSKDPSGKFIVLGTVAVSRFAIVFAAVRTGWDVDVISHDRTNPR